MPRGRHGAAKVGLSALLGVLVGSATPSCRGDECLLMHAAGTGTCGDELGWVVDICNACKVIRGCECSGPDCADVFDTEAECNDFVGDSFCRCK